MLQSDWLATCDQDTTVRLLTQLARMHARESGALAGALETLVEKQDILGLMKLDLGINTPGWDPHALYHARQVAGLFKKIEELDIGIDRKADAYHKFLKTEEKCRSTNNDLRRLAPFLGDELAVAPTGAYLPTPRFARLISGMRRKIRKVLGRCPSISELHLHHGPGATTSTKKKDACPQHKMRDGITCSTNLWASGYLPLILEEVPHWSAVCGSSHWGIRAASTDELDDSLDPALQQEILYELVTVALSHGKLGFVPKNIERFRTTITEPSINMMVQLGIGEWISDRLEMFGLSTRDQSRNADLARVGSLLGTLATLDLSSASDLISRLLVKLLLPRKWFNLLDAVRSSTVVYGKTEIALEKFSSMGNGFTFPLETLIFWACAKVATEQCCASGPALSHAEQRVSAYGDDIICPTWAANDVIAALTMCGFEVNTDKSFWSGPFRESCGTDCYMGVDVKPIYTKHLLSGEIAFALHNSYVRKGLMPYAEVVLSWIPRHLRIYGPDGYGDGHLVSDEWPRERPAELLEKGYSGFKFDTYSRIPISRKTLYPGDWVSPLYTIYSKGGVTLQDPRDIVWEPIWFVGPRQPPKHPSGHFGESPVHPPMKRRRRLVVGHFRENILRSLSSIQVTVHSKRDKKSGLWALYNTFPGSEGYRRTSIYTFA